MAQVQRITGDVNIVGALTVSAGITGQSRDGLSSDATQSYELPIQTFRIWDAFQTVLTTAASDDLGVTAGAFATGCPYITSGDLKAANTTRRGRTMFTLPPEYVNGGAVTVRFAAGMLTTVSDTTATVDVEIYKSLRTTLKTGSDLVSTSATTINSLTFAEKSFDVTAGGLATGDVLDIRVSIAINDVATVTAVIGAIAHAELLLTIKG